MRIVFMGSPAEVITPLEILLDNQAKGDFQVVAVVSQPARPAGRRRIMSDPPLALYARERKIPILQPENASSRDFLQELNELRPDIIVTAAYGQMLSDEFLALPKRAVINIHPSLLPEYRGATPVQAALLDGKTTTGVSVLFTVKKMDAGAIIEQKAYQISPAEKASDLLQSLFALGGQLTLKALAKLRDPEFLGTEQAPELVSFCRKFSKADGACDFRDSAPSIYNKFRAFYPWPGLYSFCNEERVVIESMTLGDTTERSAPGTITLVNGALRVACGTGSLLITQLKPAGSKSMPARTYFERLMSKGWLPRFTEEVIS